MRRTLSLILLWAIASTTYAQMNGNYNYSLSLRGYTLGQMPRILNESGAKYLTNAVFNGVMLKFNDNQISYRLSGSYYNKSKRFFNECETCDEADGKLTDYSFRLGFEKSFNYARIQPYFAFDVGYRSNAFTGTLESGFVDVDASKIGMIVSPGFGLKINLAEQLSVFAEGNLDFFYFYERQETIRQDAGSTKSLNKYYKSEFLLNPISVGIQFHLGNNK